jgi:uncharacterized protein (DUF2236 family)
LRDKVVGEGAEDKARAIWLAQGSRWFRETDAIWRVHDDASMFVGGIRALLLQSLHPLAMAGVAGHSGYRSDPWGRLQRTSAFLARTTFGTVDDAEAAVAQVRAIHDRVRGRAPDGRRYAASDPHLLGWVHAAEADSFLAAYRRFGATRLTAADEDEYVGQSATVAARLGVLDPPRSVADLQATLDAYRPELRGTPAAHDAARFLLLHPPLSWVERPGYACLAAGAVALLPLWAKEMLRLPALPVTERALTLPVGDAAVRTVRWALTDPRQPREDLRREWRRLNPVR